MPTQLYSPLIHQDLEHEIIETSGLPTQNSNSNDIPIINELRSPIVAHSGLNVEPLPNQELKETADINESEFKNDKETKICFECEDKASYDCLECKNSLCNDCYKPHLKKKETKHHTLTPLESESNACSIC